MKTILLAATIVTLSAGSALSADAAAAEDAPARFVWTGGYAGLQAGHGWGDSSYDVDSNAVFVPYDPNGWFGGAFAGYNHQFNNNAVVGIEADFSFGDIKAGRTSVFTPAPLPDQYGYSQIKWQGALRVRVGYAVDRLLPYVTGGVAFAKYDHSASAPWQTNQFSDIYAGWTAGAGLEYAFADNLTARIEYRYSDYGDRKYPDIRSLLAHTTNLSTQDVRLGVAYKF